MRWSQALIPTLKETPQEAKIPSHQLMIRAGLIRQVASGFYTYLPLGFRILNKVINIVREEMNKGGAEEVCLPILQPAKLWEESGRWEEYGPEMMRLQDRKDNFFSLAPTHEEMITDLARKEISTYKELPRTLYQIQAKFRDEIRPRFGVLRCREFIMKDAYSFDRDEEALEESYKKMYEVYVRIFSRCKLDFEVVEADPGIIGGNQSHEFMVPATNGEDIIVKCSKCNYAANLEMAEYAAPSKKEAKEKLESSKEVATPNMTTVKQVTKFLKVSAEKIVKTLIFTTDQGTVAALIRGDQEISLSKLGRALQTNVLELASREIIEKATGAPIGFAGPVGLKGVKIIMDPSISSMSNFVTGANKGDKHLLNVNFERDFSPDKVVGIRYAQEGDLCPKCKKSLQFKAGIELGHIFKLGTKYSQAMKATFVDKGNKEKPFIMGCYGIGIDRIIAASIEQNHDSKGITFSPVLAPYQILIMPLNYNDKVSREKADKLYAELEKKGIEVLLDDRDLRAGVKFKDADLIGIPYRIVFGPKAQEKGEVEINYRTGEKKIVKEDKLLGEIEKIISS